MSEQLTEEQREKLIDALALQVIEGMDWKSLEQYAYEQLSNYYMDLDNDELVSEATEYFNAPIDEII